jgi:hypothetical protein
MKTLPIIFVFACLTICGCKPESVEVPFSFAFPDESDGCGTILVRKLSVRQTDAIYVNLDLSSGYDFRKLFAGTSDPLVFNLSSTQTVKQCWIDELSGKPEDFRWGHFAFSENVRDRWVGTSGTITVRTYRMPEDKKLDGFLTSIQLSNVVFRSSNTKRLTRLDSMSFTNVHVGWTPL